MKSYEDALRRLFFWVDPDPDALQSLEWIELSHHIPWDNTEIFAFYISIRFIHSVKSLDFT